MTHDVRTSSASDLGRLRESARQRFAHELPELLQNHLGCWVAYHGDQQVGIARHTGKLHEMILRQRLSADEVMLFEIAGSDEEIVFGPAAFD